MVNMKVWICDMTKPAEDGAAFFNVMLEIDAESLAVLLEGFRYFEGRIYPPAKPWKGKNYTSVLLSPGLARQVGEALKTSGFEDAEFDADSWSAAKWGQTGLKRLCNNDEIAMEVWSRYREKK